MFRNLTFVVHISYLSNAYKGLIFVFSSNFWATFDTQSNLLRNYWKLFGNWISSNLWKALEAAVHKFLACTAILSILDITVFDLARKWKKSRRRLCARGLSFVMTGLLVMGNVANLCHFLATNWGLLSRRCFVRRSKQLPCNSNNGPIILKNASSANLVYLLGILILWKYYFLN